MFVVFLVPPKSDYRPEFKRGDVKTSTSDDLKGPYMEHVNWNFTCCIRNVLPGKGSTLFEFYYNGNLRLQSKDNVGQVEESSEHDHTKQVKWIFTSSFNRSDNAGKMKCHVNWKAGRHKSGLESIPTDNVEVRCKYPHLERKICLDNKIFWKTYCIIWYQPVSKYHIGTKFN